MLPLKLDFTQSTIDELATLWHELEYSVIWFEAQIEAISSLQKDKKSLAQNMNKIQERLKISLLRSLMIQEDVESQMIINAVSSQEIKLRNISPKFKYFT